MSDEQKEFTVADYLEEFGPLNEWQKTLNDEQITSLSYKGIFPLPRMPSYSYVKKLGNGIFFGEIGYGNATEHRLLLAFPEISFKNGRFFCGIENRGFFHFDLFDASIRGLHFSYINEKMGVLPWEAHLLSLVLKTILKRITCEQDPSWGRHDEHNVFIGE